MKRNSNPCDERNVLVGGTVLRTHRSADCAGYWCPIHNTSLHHMRTWDQVYKPDGMYRVCPHNIIHPDPDDPNEFLMARDHRVFGCDGCCSPLTRITRGQSSPTPKDAA